MPLRAGQRAAPGRTRRSCEPDGTVTKLNEPGSTLSDADLAAIATAVRTSVRRRRLARRRRAARRRSSRASRCRRSLAEARRDRRAARHRLERRRAGVGARIAKPRHHQAEPRGARRAGRAASSARSPPSSRPREEVRELWRRARAREPRRRGRRARRAGRDAHGRIARRRSPAAPSARATASSRDSCPASPTDEGDVEAALLEALDLGSRGDAPPGQRRPDPGRPRPLDRPAGVAARPGSATRGQLAIATVPELPVRRSTNHND